MGPLRRPLLIYDGDCGFCRAWIARWRGGTGETIDYAPSQRVAGEFPGVPPERFRESVVLIEPGGRVTFGAEAVLRARAAAGHGAGLAFYGHMPGFAALSEFAYRVVARHRPLFTVLTRLLWGEHLVPPGERLTAWVYLRALGVVYLVAFASLGVQVTGLVGSHGVLPLGAFLANAWSVAGLRAVWVLPTLGWVNASDLALQLQCWAGAAAALLLVIGFAPAVMLAIAWVLYLSLATSGQEFLWFQWDSLLLEAGLLAIFLAPLVLRSHPRRDPPPSRAALWATRWLLCRLMFSSAAAKWMSGDIEWRRLSALTHHYETQPLPTWIAWYAHHLPARAHAASAAIMFAIEGGAPLLMLCPRRVRITAAAVLASLQILIALTGNYGFFNVLALALCLTMLDDAVWPAWMQRLAGDRAATTGARGRWPRSVVRPVAATLVLLSLVPLVRTFRAPPPWMAPLVAAYRMTSPFHLVNPYGLFAVMTTHRDEIVLEGSRDGHMWTPYAFRWKPGRVTRAPAFVAPHMPRLDWQMWFAALEPDHVPQWFAGLCAGILRGDRPVLALLGPNPFPDRPPSMLRARLVAYRFSTPAECRATGAWWIATPRGEYLPPVVLQDGELRLVAATPDP